MTNLARDEEPRSFGRWLSQRRRDLDLTQARLGRRVGCTAAMIRKIEADERKPSLQLAELLATTLGIPGEAHTAFVQFARGGSHVPGLPAEFGTGTRAPRVRFISQGATNRLGHDLPAPMTSFVNRARDVASLLELLTRPDVRLVTLLGPPGIGKTRLCVYVAEQIIERLSSQFSGGIWFVDLASLDDARLVVPAIAHSLSIAEAGAAPLLDRLCAALSDTRLLLVLDNFEQVSAAAMELAVLLRRCKGVKILATSRTPLLLAGEHEYVVPTLPVPPAAVFDSVQASGNQMAYESVELFVARVRQYQPDFAVTAESAEQIGRVCRRLDGIPLAIELAAAALRRMSMAHLAALLTGETGWLHELHTPARDLPPRQRTLAEAVAWSYRLLDAAAQTFLRRLSVFAGGFTCEDAQAICGADQAALENLADQNLLVRAPGRLHMLEIVHEFAQAQLGIEEKAGVQQRFVRYYVDEAAHELDDIAVEYPNFRAALVLAIGAQGARAALLLCRKLSWFWEANGYLSEGLTLARAALAVSGPVEPDVRIDALECVSPLAWKGHQFDEAIQLAVAAADLARANSRPGKLALALNQLGRILLEQGEYDRAEVILQEGVGVARQNLYLFNPGFPFTLLGELALARGELETAKTYLAQAVPLLEDGESNLLVGAHLAMALTDLAEVALARGDPLRAQQELHLALPIARISVRRLRCLLVTLGGVGLRARRSRQNGRIDGLAELFGAVAGLGERSGERLSPFFQALASERSECAQKLLPPHDWDAAWERGYNMTLSQAAAAAEARLAPTDLPRPAAP